MGRPTDPKLPGGEVCRSVHRHCCICGPTGILGLKAVFRQSDDGWTEATLTGSGPLQGYAGVMHGGIISLLLDAAMTNCLFAHGCAGVTARMEVKFRHPVVADGPVNIRAKLVSSSPPVHELKAELLQERQVKATATALFFAKPLEGAGEDESE